MPRVSYLFDPLIAFLLVYRPRRLAWLEVEHGSSFSPCLGTTTAFFFAEVFSCPSPVSLAANCTSCAFPAALVYPKRGCLAEFTVTTTCIYLYPLYLLSGLVSPMTVYLSVFQSTSPDTFFQHYTCPHRSATTNFSILTL